MFPSDPSPTWWLRGRVLCRCSLQTRPLRHCASVAAVAQHWRLRPGPVSSAHEEAVGNHHTHYLQAGSHGRHPGTRVVLLSESCACALSRRCPRWTPCAHRSGSVARAASLLPRTSGPSALTSTCISSCHQIRLLHARVVSALLPVRALFLVYLESVDKDKLV